MFNYQNLESKQFEELCRDIMQVKTGKKLHVFARGKDHGVDLTDDSNAHNIIVQVKHYQKSSFADLKRNLSKEVENVKALSPGNYYICVSQSLTDSNVNEIYLMFSEFMKDASNILTLDDIDAFLHEPDNLQITKIHTNLWIESGTTLQLLMECFPGFSKPDDHGSNVISGIRKEKVDMAGDYIVMKGHQIKQIDIIAFEMPYLREHWGSDLIKCLKKGTNIRLLVMDPKSIFLDFKAIEDGVTSGDKKNAMHDLAEWVRESNEKSENGKIHLKYYNGMTKYFYMRIDDCLYTGPYVDSEESMNATTYEHRVGTKEYIKYSRQFEDWWSKASES